MITSVSLVNIFWHIRLLYFFLGIRILGSSVLANFKYSINIWYNIINYSHHAICWIRQWHPTPWGHQESDTTEWLHFHFSLSCIGEGNGNPLQCSCLEIPGTRSLVGCHLWGRTESDMTEETAVAAACYLLSASGCFILSDRAVFQRPNCS